MKVMAVMIGLTGGESGPWGLDWDIVPGRLTNMRSQEDNGEQQSGPQPDHAPEADQASQDKRGPRSVTLGLAAQSVIVCVGVGEEGEVRWLGWEGWEGTGWEGLILFLGL